MKNEQMFQSAKSDFVPKNILKQRICSDLNRVGIQIGLRMTGRSCIGENFRPVIIALPTQKIRCSYIDRVVPAYAMISHYSRSKQAVGIWFKPEFFGVIDSSPNFGGFGKNQKLGHLGQYNFTSKGIFLGSGNFRPVSTPIEREISQIILDCLERHDPKFAQAFSVSCP